MRVYSCEARRTKNKNTIPDTRRWLPWTSTECLHRSDLSEAHRLVLPPFCPHIHLFHAPLDHRLLIHGQTWHKLIAQHSRDSVCQKRNLNTFQSPTVAIYTKTSAFLPTPQLSIVPQADYSPSSTPAPDTPPQISHHRRHGPIS